MTGRPCPLTITSDPIDTARPAQLISARPAAREATDP
jgi:hypothetical protein